MENRSSDIADKYSSKILLRKNIFQLLTCEINMLRWIHAETTLLGSKEYL